MKFLKISRIRKLSLFFVPAILTLALLDFIHFAPGIGLTTFAVVTGVLFAFSISACALVVVIYAIVTRSLSARRRMN
jgi:hypothetical protein